MCFHLGMTEGFVWDYGQATERYTSDHETCSLLQEIYKQIISNKALHYSHHVSKFLFFYYNVYGLHQLLELVGMLDLLKMGQILKYIMPRGLHLVNSKCVPVLLYGLEACPMNNADKKSLDFALNRFLFKLFKTSNKDVVDECSWYFGFCSASERIARLSVRFINRFNNSDNLLCQIVKDY